MFDELSAKLTGALQRLTGRGVLTEEAVRERWERHFQSLRSGEASLSKRSPQARTDS